MSRLARPIFLLGCGRSGTTILGRTLAEHRDLHYLNEPRDLWARAYPSTDVWSAEAGRRRGRVVLTAADASWWRTRRLERLFAASVARSRRARLLEKLPVNAFRVPFLGALFPDAVFIHLLRNGIEVAHSIERECATGPWYGADDYKWHELVRVASVDDAHRALLPYCREPYERGLLEWRLAVEHVQRTTSDLPAERLLVVRYEALLDRPRDTVRRIEAFLGLAHDETPSAYAERHVERRSAEASMLAVTPSTTAIAGDLLAALGHAASAATSRG